MMQPGDNVLLPFIGGQQKNGDSVDLPFGVTDDAVRGTIRLVSPIGTPSVRGKPRYNVSGNIGLESPLKTPSLGAYSYLKRTSQISLESPLKTPAARVKSWVTVRPEILLQGPVATPTVKLRGTNLVEILGITVQWNYTDWAFDLSVEWRFTGTEDEFTGQLSYTGEIIIGSVVLPFSTTETHYTFHNIPPEVAWELTVRPGADGPERIVSGVTTREVPAQVTGITFIPTIDALLFSWDEADRADEYRARLYRDGALVEEQTVLTGDVTFSGLEDGIDYILEVAGINETGPGFSSSRSAQTLFIVPSAPTNLEQQGMHWVLAQVLWDAPPEKVHFYESVIDLEVSEGVFVQVHRGIIPDEPTERLYGLPKAASKYLWKIRAGNPGGLSDFAELEITTRPFEIDSRLAVLPAAYQEDFLFPDTWDGGTDAPGLGEPQSILGSAVFSDGERRNYYYGAIGESRFGINASFQTDTKMLFSNGSDAANCGVELSAEFSTADQILESTKSEAANVALSLNSAFATSEKMFIHSDEDAAETAFSIIASFVFEENL